jgi:hypothetical protein
LNLPARSRPAPPTPRRRRGVSIELTLKASAAFCHQCGTKAQVSDQFFRNCGSRLPAPTDPSAHNRTGELELWSIMPSSYTILAWGEGQIADA